MRHQHRGGKLNRDASSRKALFQGLLNAIIEHGTIRTTHAKAKALRPLIEKMVTKAKKQDSVHNRRLAFATLRNRGNVTRLFEQLAPTYVNRPGGYVRIVKCGFRVGDSAPMAVIQFVVEASE